MALRSKKPFALMRPLGHHATPTVAMGFCSFELDRDRNRCERDGIWDFDGLLRKSKHNNRIAKDGL